MLALKLYRIKKIMHENKFKRVIFHVVMILRENNHLYFLVDTYQRVI